MLIDTFGGSAYSGLGVAGIIRQSKTPVHTICTSKAMSAGLLILIAGHKRYAYKTSYMLYHQLSGGTYGSYEYNKFEVAKMEVLHKQISKFIVKHSNIKKSDLRKYDKLSKDWLICAEEAIKLGIIDELL